jgi:prepilin-type N-terminal cleavage/methylation domain-containing protein
MFNSMKSPTPAVRPQGFSMIELLVVIAIIAVLAALAIPTYNSIMDRMTISKVQNEHMRGLTASMALYRADHMNKWPMPNPPGGEQDTWCGPGTGANADEEKSKEVMKALRPYYGKNDIKEDGTFKDPWGTQYAMKWDIDSGPPRTPPNSKVEYGGNKGPTNQNIPKDFIVVSMGKNRTQDSAWLETSDDVFSFCAFGDRSLFK